MSDDEVRRRTAESFNADDGHEPTEQDYVAADRLLAARDGRRAHELAEKLREWGEEGAMRLAMDDYGLPLHRSPFYMYEDADRAADLIDPEVKP